MVASQISGICPLPRARGDYMLPNNPMKLPVASGARNYVRVGSHVCVTLASGEDLSGELGEANAEAITLVRPRSYAFKERVVSVSDIKQLEVLVDAGGNPRFTPVGAALTTVFVAFLVVLSQLPLHGMDQGSFRVLPRPRHSNQSLRQTNPPVASRACADAGQTASRLNHVAESRRSR
jgi:hypothetical protein